MEFTSTGIITSLGSELKTKNNEKKSTFRTHTVKHTDGPLAGKTFFAQRTLSTTNEAGEAVTKEDVKVGQEVTLYNQVVDGKIYTQISTGVAVANEAELLNLVMASQAPATQNALSEQQM